MNIQFIMDDAPKIRQQPLKDGCSVASVLTFVNSDMEERKKDFGIPFWSFLLPEFWISA